MELEKMDLLELRQQVIAGSAHILQGRIYPQAVTAFDELARRLALKDADLLLERDRAEKAEKELAEAQKMLDFGPLRILKERAEKAEAQVKMLVEALDTERLAELEHEQWAHWTDYMLAHSSPENVVRWVKQCATSYHELSEEEKENDRKWARIINQEVLAKIKEEHESAPTPSAPSQGG